MKLKFYGEDDDDKLMARQVHRCGQKMLEFLRKEASSNMTRAAWTMQSHGECPAFDFVGSSYDSGKLACSAGESVSEETGMCMAGK